MRQRALNQIMKLYGGRDKNTLTKLLYREINMNDIDDLYKFCKDNNILDSFSVALALNAINDDSYLYDMEKYNKHIDYKAIDYAFSFDSDDNRYMSTEDACDYFLNGMGIGCLYSESREILRNKFYHTVKSNVKVLERLVNATRINGNISSLEEIENVIYEDEEVLVLAKAE